MTKPFLKLSIFIIMLGVLALSMNTVFGQNTVVYIHQINVNGVIMYKYDFWSYIENIKNTFTNVAQLQLTIQTLEWEDNFGDGMLDYQFWQALVNNLAYMLNIVITGLNVLLYPIRIVFYAIQMALSLIGIPTIEGQYNDNSLKWLIDTCKVLTSLQIPYVS